MSSNIHVTRFSAHANDKYKLLRELHACVPLPSSWQSIVLPQLATTQHDSYSFGSEAVLIVGGRPLSSEDGGHAHFPFLCCAVVDHGSQVVKVVDLPCSEQGGAILGHSVHWVPSLSRMFVFFGTNTVSPVFELVPPATPTSFFQLLPLASAVAQPSAGMRLNDDSQSNSPSSSSSSPALRAFHASCTWGRNVVIHGGAKAQGASPFGDVWVFDAVSGAWHEVHMQTAASGKGDSSGRIHHTVMPVGSDGRTFAILGGDGEKCAASVFQIVYSNPTDNTRNFDQTGFNNSGPRYIGMRLPSECVPKGLEFSLQKSALLPHSHSRFISFGGMTNHNFRHELILRQYNFKDDIHVFQSETSSRNWTTETPLDKSVELEGRVHHCMVTTNSSIIVVGGTRGHAPDCVLFTIIFRSQDAGSNRASSPDTEMGSPFDEDIDNDHQNGPNDSERNFQDISRTLEALEHAVEHSHFSAEQHLLIGQSLRKISIMNRRQYIWRTVHPQNAVVELKQASMEGQMSAFGGKWCDNAVSAIKTMHEDPGFSEGFSSQRFLAALCSPNSGFLDMIESMYFMTQSATLINLGRRMVQLNFEIFEVCTRGAMIDPSYSQDMSAKLTDCFIKMCRLLEYADEVDPAGSQRSIRAQQHGSRETNFPEAQRVIACLKQKMAQLNASGGSVPAGFNQVHGMFGQYMERWLRHHVQLARTAAVPRRVTNVSPAALEAFLQKPDPESLVALGSMMAGQQERIRMISQQRLQATSEAGPDSPASVLVLCPPREIQACLTSLCNALQAMQCVVGQAYIAYFGIGSMIVPFGDSLSLGLAREIANTYLRAGGINFFDWNVLGAVTADVTWSTFKAAALAAIG